MAPNNGSWPVADWRAVRERLRNADFGGLFVEELGWDPLPRALPLEVAVGAPGTEEKATYELSPVAEKRGFVAYRCPPAPDGKIPHRSARDAIDRRVAKDAYEHLVVYSDADEAEQVWQWARREPGRPAARREHRLGRDAGGVAPGTARTAPAVLDETGFAGKVDLVAIERSERELVAIQHEMESVLQAINAGAPASIDALADVRAGTIDLERPKDTELTPAQARFLEEIQAPHGELLRVGVKTGRFRFDVGFPNRHGEPEA